LLLTLNYVLTHIGYLSLTTNGIFLKPGGRLTVDNTEKWSAFILWLATPTSERGEIFTEDQWAKANGYYDASTMRRWKKNPKFIELQEKITGRMVAKTNAVVTFDDEDLTLDVEERNYLQVKQKIIQAAKDGNLKAQELFIKNYGQTWIEEERASRSSDFANLDLPMLLAKAIAAIDESVMVVALTEQGYTVSKGETE